MVAGDGLTPARLEAFSDGVIAVIITVMVLELKVPASDGFAGLREVLPMALVYLLSFVQTGIYWVNHHYLIDEVETVGHGLLWANLAFLFCLSLIPFATAWLGLKGLTSFATALYAATCALPGIAYSILSGTVRRRAGAMLPGMPTREALSVGMYLAAIPLAWWRPVASLGLIAVVALMWLRPPQTGELGCTDRTGKERRPEL